MNSARKKSLALLMAVVALAAVALLSLGAGNSTPLAEARAPGAVWSSWKSDLFSCSVTHRRTEYTFAFRLYGRSNNFLVNASRLRYKITPYSARSNRNNLNIGPSMYSASSVLQEGRLSAGRGWQSKTVRLEMRRGVLHMFEAIFDRRRASDPRCTGTLVL